MQDELTAAINTEADRAAMAWPEMPHRQVLAEALHEEFPDFSTADIEWKLSAVWRSRNLLFATLHS